MRGIPIDILRAFVAVVEARGFTRAAEELGRTQPTISLQVKRLEELVEAPLFKKGGRFELSPMGKSASIMESACCGCMTTCSTSLAATIRTT